MSAQGGGAQHTPGPWRVGDAGYTVFGSKPTNSGLAETVAPVRNRHNAAFIVRACNSHDALLAALKETLRALEQHLSDEANEHGLKHCASVCPCWDNEVQRARAAIAAATAGEGK